MKKTALALAAATGIAVAGLSAPLAQASSGLHVTVSPAKPAVGQTVKIHATGAIKNYKHYICILAIDKPGVKPGASLGDIADNVDASSNAKGVINCQLPFLPFKGTYKGQSISCPPTKAQKKQGWYCGAAIANLNNHNQFTIARFKF